MKAWTDYPFVWLGDTSGEPAPIREVEVRAYDGNKYCRIRVADGEDEIKAGYLYVAPGRCGEVERVKLSSLDDLASNTVLSRVADSGSDKNEGTDSATSA